MLRSLRRWAQATVAVLAAALAATVVVLCALQRYPQASSAVAVHDTMQLQLASLPPNTLPPTLPPTPGLLPITLPPTLPPPPGLLPKATVAPTGEAVPTAAGFSQPQTDEAPQKGGFLEGAIGYIGWFTMVLFCCLIQLCCYMRSTHEPADIEEGLEASPQIVNQDLWGPRLLLTQMVKLVEMCGFEAKNRYVSGDGNFYIDERSDCPQRCCASVNRELTLFGHAGPSEEAPVVLRMFKPYHLQGCCCCRPVMHIDMPMDGKMVDVGRIEDPFKCCAVNQMIFDSNDDLRYEVTGSMCQSGACCACCADFHFDVNDPRGATVGAITKKALTCQECCFKTNRFEVDFPRQCTMEEKRLLVGSAMLLDLQYFEQNKNDK